MTHIDALRWVLATEGAVVFLASVFVPRLYPSINPPRALLLLRRALVAVALSTAVSVGVNALLQPPATPGLYVGLALLTPASVTAVTAVVYALRGDLET